MDPIQTLGGAAGLKKIADALRAENFPIDAVYLIRLVADNHDDHWVVRLVTRANSQDVMVKTFELRNGGKIPMFGARIGFAVVPPEDSEARQIIAQAKRYGYAPVEFGDVLLDRLYVDFALVADFPGAHVAAA